MDSSSSACDGRQIYITSSSQIVFLIISEGTEVQGNEVDRI